MKKIGELFFPAPINGEFLQDTLCNLYGSEIYGDTDYEKRITPSTNGLRVTVWQKEEV